MAASAGAIKAGRAYVELFADDSKLVRGLESAEKRLKAFGAGVKALGQKLLAMGAAIAAPLAAATQVFAGMGETLANMSIRTGISVETLSQLGYAAEQSGADLAILEGALRRMQRLLSDAERGSTTAARALDQLGLSVDDVLGLAPDKQFALIADRLSRIEDPGRKTALAMDIFGRAGTGLLPMINDGAAGIEALMQRARELGLVISTEDAQAAEAFGDVLDDLWKVIKSGVFAIGAALAPLLEDFAVSAIRIAKNTAEWIRENKSLVVTVFQVALAIAAAGSALIALGLTISGLGSLLGTAADEITGIGKVLGLLAPLLSSLLTPIGLVSAAVAGLGAYLIYTSGAGTEALGWLGRKFNDLKEVAAAAWQGISDALASGDIGLAARILWLTLKLEWQKGVDALNQHWLALKEVFLSAWTDAVYGVASIATSAWAGLEAGWTETVAFLSDAWTLFTSTLTRTWNTAVGFIRKAWVRLKSLFDSDVDADAEIARINDEVAAQNESAQAEQDRTILARDQARQERLSEIETGRSGAQSELDAMREAEQAQHRQQHVADLQASESALEQARSEWQSAIDQAARQREAAEADGLDGLSDGPSADDLFDDLQERVAAARNIDFGLTQQQRQAIQLQALGAGAQAPEEQTARNTAQMIAELKAQNKTLRDLLAQQKQTPAQRVATIG